MMSLSEMFKKSATKTGDEFSEMEDAMAGMIDLELDAPSIEMEQPDEPAPETMETASAGPRLTAYAQSRLAALMAFDELQRSAAEDLDQLSAALTRVNAARHSTREFLSSLHTSVYRANEVEIAHDALLAENRRLAQQVEQVKRLRTQHESQIEAGKRREAKLQQDNDALKVDLGRLGLEANDTLNRLSAMESERAELLNTVAVRSAAAERHARENEILREKQINLSLDLENAQRRQTEVERKFDELTAVHNAETAQLSELRGKLSEAEKEITRREKQADAAQIRIEELHDQLASADTVAEDAVKRHENDVRALRTEIDTLKARLEASARAQFEASDEIGALKQRLADAAAERKIAEDRLATLLHEVEDERQAMVAHAARRNEDYPDAEIQELRAEIETLRETVRKLGPYERMHKLAKERREKQSRAQSDAA